MRLIEENAAVMNDLLDAVADGDLALVRRLVREHPAWINLEEDELQPLMLACRAGAQEIVATLLQAGADPNYLDTDGETPLHVASYEGHCGIVAILLQHGASPLSQTEEGKTPLMNAAQGGNVASLDLLLAAGASVVSADEEGRTALHWAVAGGHDETEVVAKLVEAGANPDDSSRSGHTAADYARELGLSRIHEFLKTYGTSG